MRKALGLTQERIARLFGYPDAQMIGRYERAETTIPGPTKALMYLMHDEQVNGNKHAVRDYMVRALTSQHHGNKGE
jgi:transcriptional regulator with XRE-family HTH domain